MLASLYGAGASDLRRHGAVHAQRLDAESARLAAELYEAPPPDVLRP